MASCISPSNDRRLRSRSTKAWLLESPKPDLGFALDNALSSARVRGRRTTRAPFEFTTEDSLLIDTSLGLSKAHGKNAAKEKSKAKPSIMTSLPLKEVAVNQSDPALDEMTEQELERLAWQEMSREEKRSKVSKPHPPEPMMSAPPKSPSKIPRLNQSVAGSAKEPTVHPMDGSSAPFISIGSSIAAAAESREARRRRLGLAPLLPIHAAAADPGLQPIESKEIIGSSIQRAEMSSKNRKSSHQPNDGAGRAQSGSGEKQRRAADKHQLVPDLDESHPEKVSESDLRPSASAEGLHLTAAQEPISMSPILTAHFSLPRSVSPHRKGRRNPSPKRETYEELQSSKAISPPRKKVTHSNLQEQALEQMAVSAPRRSARISSAHVPSSPGKAQRGTKARIAPVSPVPIEGISFPNEFTFASAPKRVQQVAHIEAAKVTPATTAKEDTVSNAVSSTRTKSKLRRKSLEAKVVNDKRKAIKMASAIGKGLAAGPTCQAPDAAPAGFRLSSTGHLVPAVAPRTFSFDAGSSLISATAGSSTTIVTTNGMTARQRAMLDAQRAKDASAATKEAELQRRSRYKANDVPLWIRKRKEQLQAEGEARLQREIESVRRAELGEGKKSGPGKQHDRHRQQAARKASLEDAKPFVSSIDARLAERAEWERKRKANEDALEAARQVARAEKLKREEEEYQEARRRAVPKANPVPEWLYGGRVPTEGVGTASAAGKGKVAAKRESHRS
ncbi:hypothetical protein K437DRAFT_268122 [Tilletiaria anomala UBC 951]|uniref:TPX2 C-terminal domain-containing protein n=1 Tax=Tilletiaria anomala (strain ATCC 24038 / CBS 436.72 / UBC 951) TaxID=1037660 RepID=A0A066W5X0_TILAU|nr:uncharacterized protein K437DRAFT_268122 [Tilletiaria anomala UBC 951]KDN46474.1 hypothetical protein K437DRAFT_268122 [Tilletiaria anomala UBC 951]